MSSFLIRKSKNRVMIEGYNSTNAEVAQANNGTEKQGIPIFVSELENKEGMT